MDSIGEILRQAREKGNLSLDQVARDTHISKRFLLGLEDESFGEFPAETYVIGFLRTYAEHLGLDSGQILNLYKNLRIQEQPLPINELLDAGQRPAILKVLLIVAIIAVVLGGGYAAYRLIPLDFVRRAAERSQARERVKVEAAEEGVGTEYEFREEEVMVRWFSLNDVILVPVGETEAMIKIVGLNDWALFETPLGEEQLAMEEELLLDLDEDGYADLRIVLNAVDDTDVDLRANLGLYKVSETEDRVAVEDGATRQSAVTAISARVAAPMRSEKRNIVVIQESLQSSPFVVDMSFRGSCLVSFRVDGAEREQRFFQNRENFSLDVRETLKLWISNAGAVGLEVEDRDLDIGRAGQVSVMVVEWVEDSTGGVNQLRLMPAF